MRTLPNAGDAVVDMPPIGGPWQAAPIRSGKWCSGTCYKCSAGCALLANHGSSCICRSHFIPVRRSEAENLKARYGVTAWFGDATRLWWAMDGGRLVEATTPDRLGAAVMAARGWSP